MMGQGSTQTGTSETNQYAETGLDNIKSHIVLGKPSDIMSNTSNYYRPYKVVFPKREDWTERDSELLGTDVCCFTNGDDSKNEGGVRPEMFRQNPKAEFSHSLGGLTTVFQAEIDPTDTCASCWKRNDSQGRIKIYSDSQAALKAFESNQCIYKTVWNCRQTLNRFGERNRFSLVLTYWIKKHEREDTLEKLWAETPFIGPELILSISSARNVILSWIKKRGFNIFLTYQT